MAAGAEWEATAGAAASALSRVLEAPGMLSKCTAYQDGEKFSEYADGDVAAAQGHLSLLRLRRAQLPLLLPPLRQDRNTRVDDDGSNSNSQEEKEGDGSKSSRQEEQIDGGNRGSGGQEVDNGSSSSSSSDEEEEVDESDRDGGVAGRDEGGGGARENMAVSGDLRFSHRAADWAATQGHLEVVRWLLENREEGCTESAVDGACWNGHEETVRWLVCDWGQAGTERALDYAASTGRLELVKWLTRQGATCTVGAMDGAAGGGHLDVVRWLATNRLEGCSQAAFDMAAAEGHLHVIKWLEGGGFLRCSSTGLDSAAGGGHLHVLQWMLDHKAEYECTSNAYGLAASRGRVDVLRWLRAAMPNLRCPAWAAETAAAAGHLMVVRWLHDSGVCPASLAILDDVAAEGRLDAVVWLSERRAGASEAAVDRAAEAGHADVVDYLLKNRQEGCSSAAMVEAARNGHLSTVKLLREFGRERDECCLAARAVAAASGHVEVARWLDESDPDLFRALQEAVSDWRIDGGNAGAQERGVETSTDGSRNTDGGAGGVGRNSELMAGNSVGEQATATNVEISIDGENVEEGSRSVGDAQVVAVEISIDGGGRSTIKPASGASDGTVEGGDGAEGENGRCRGRCRCRGGRCSADGENDVESGAEEEEEEQQEEQKEEQEEECGNEHRQQQGRGGFDEVVDTSDGCADVVSADRDAAAAIGGGEAVVDPPRTGLVIEGRARATGGGNSLISSRESSREALREEGTHGSSYHAGARGRGREPRALSVDDAKQDTTRCKKSSGGGGVGLHPGGQRVSTARVDDCCPAANVSTAAAAVIRARHKKTVSSPSSPQQLGGANGTQGRPFLAMTGAATPAPLARSLGFLLGGGVAIACCLVWLAGGTIATMAGRRQQEP